MENSSESQANYDLSQVLKVSNRSRHIINKNSVSLVISAIIGVIGIVILLAGRQDKTAVAVSHSFLSCGIFAFAGGFTNWLAVFMLFNRIPWIYGSGVIPKRYIEIRKTVKDVILKTFFEERFVSEYLLDKFNALDDNFAMKDKIRNFLSSDQIDGVIGEKLDALRTSQPLGQSLTNMGFDVKSLQPLVKPFIIGFGEDLMDHLKNDFSQSWNVSKLQSIFRSEIDSYLDIRSKQLTADIVTRILRDVIHQHLGWIVVWGCTFGGLFGIFFQGIGLGPLY